MKLLLLLIAVALAPLAHAAPGITLAWDDNSSAESGFIIQRSVGTGPFVEIARVGANITTYFDGTATAELTTYSYRVWAYKGSYIQGQPDVLSPTFATATLTLPLNGPTNARANQVTTITMARGAKLEVIASK